MIEMLPANEIVLAQLRGEGGDPTPNKIMTRLAERIVEKGFQLDVAGEDFAKCEDFTWGRSSTGRRYLTSYTVEFFDEKTEKTGLVRINVQKAIYERKNPYDRIPAGDGKVSYVLLATNETKQMLDWEIKRERD